MSTQRDFRRGSQGFRSLSEIIHSGIPIEDKRVAANSETSAEHNNYIRASDWSKSNGRSKAARVLRFIDFCVGCGANAEERHHKDGDPTNNALSNLVPLCGTCHQLSHGKYPRKTYDGQQSRASYFWRNPA